MSKLDHIESLIRMARRIAIQIPESINKIPLESEDYVPVEVKEVEPTDMLMYEQVEIELPTSINNAIESMKVLHYTLDGEENTIAVDDKLSCTAFVAGVGEGDEFRKEIIAIMMPSVNGLAFELPDEEMSSIEEKINLHNMVAPAIIGEAIEQSEDTVEPAV